MANDITVLLKVSDKPIAEEIQRILEDAGIYTLLKSDNPASSALSMYVGSQVSESITMYVTKDDYVKATNTLQDTPYWDLLAEES